MPLFWFLLGWWLWRFVTWGRLLKDVARCNLRLIATHPDRCGGLSFIGKYPGTYLLFVFAISTVVAATVLKAVEAVNEEQKKMIFRKIVEHFRVTAGRKRPPGKKPLAGRTIAVWGLSFKPRTDDMREAPSVVIIDNLLRAGAEVRAHDPVAMNEAYKIFKDRIFLAGDSYEALRGADALAVVTEWNEFRTPDFARMKKLMKTPVIFDGRNVYSQDEVRKLGFTYYGMGRR